MPAQLILVRHGESTFNAGQIFTGLLDVPLSENGARQCRVVDELLIDAGIRPDLTITTPLRRAHHTAQIIVEDLDLNQPKIDWRLAERDYGCLTGMPKRAVREQFGEQNFFCWRRTVDGRPPAASEAQIAGWDDDLMREDLGPLRVGMSESLRDVIGRVEPAWLELKQSLTAGQTVMVVAHGNSLRALCGIVGALTDDELTELNLPAASPLVFEFDDELRPIHKLGRYLDEETANARAAKVAAEGGT